MIKVFNNKVVAKRNQKSSLFVEGTGINGLTHWQKKQRLEIRGHVIMVTTVKYHSRLSRIWAVLLEEKAKLNHFLLKKKWPRKQLPVQLFLMRKEYSPSRNWDPDNWKIVHFSCEVLCFGNFPKYLEFLYQQQSIESYYPILNWS